MRKIFMIVFIFLIIISAIIGMYLRPYYKNTNIYDMNNARVKVDTEISFIELSYKDRINYENSFNNEIVARVEFKSRKIYGNKVIANVQVKDVFLGDISQKNINIIEDIEYSIEDGETIILSKGLYIPMQQGKEYIVNIKKVANNLYLFTTIDFSCYIAEETYDVFEIKEMYESITPDIYMKNIILTLSKDYESTIENVTTDEYIKIKNLSIENAKKYMSSK